MATQAPFGFIGWMALVGMLLLIMALATSHIRGLPVSSSLIYLGIGVLLGPIGLRWARVEITATPELVERVTEVGVIISLFVGGLKLRLPLSDPAWRAAYRLAAPAMLLCIVGVALVTHLTFGMGAASSLLVASILAPTDPVLASAVSVSSARDADRMRYALSGEAGLNDGMAFPFVVLALSWLEHGRWGSWVLPWGLSRVLWAVPVGLATGYILGRCVGRLAIWLRTRQPDSSAPNDLLLLALIFLSYVAAEQIHAWGFLAVFAAGIGLRHAEVRAVTENPHPSVTQATEEGEEPDELHPPAEHLVDANVEAHTLKEPAVSAGVLVAETLTFGQALERIVEFSLVVFVGVALASHWEVRALIVAALLTLVIRPLSALACLLGTPTTLEQRSLIGWFGIRGIGSLYYLGYAQTHGLSGGAAHSITAIVVSVVALSIVVHGITGSPLVMRYERRLAS